MPLAPAMSGGPVPARAQRGRSHSGLRENGLMATYDEDQVTIARVLARPVTRGRQLLAPDSSLDPGIQDIVAGRLRTELS